MKTQPLILNILVASFCGCTALHSFFFFSSLSHDSFIHAQPSSIHEIKSRFVLFIAICEQDATNLHNRLRASRRLSPALRGAPPPAPPRTLPAAGSDRRPRGLPVSPREGPSANHPFTGIKSLHNTQSVEVLFKMEF